ncbi:serine/threonine-protein kinase [Kitasatospora sp. NPDC127111]|uniref:serine/threonine-protein kinase n=1 Tax=Kitasatospora sp. NPDC127111 TaxID=3345363 RepID=UPI00364340D2
MSSRGTVLGGRYTLTGRIGGGGMGSVWRADDEVLARPVAVKILHPGLVEDGAFVQRFRREAQLLAALKHPGIVDVHDYGESGGDAEDRIAYIVMELVDGQPLDQVLTDDGPMPAQRALGLLATALDALHAAHRRDIVHRDVKPSNLMLRPDGRVTVTDFGIARAVASTRITASHAVIGTALYMAPEQAEGKAVTPASDLYSIGVVAFELLTGQPPFDGESVLEVALKHIREPAPELPADFPPEVRTFVATALAKKAEDRFADAAAMAAAARAAIGASGAPSASGASGAPSAAAATPRAAKPAKPAEPAGEVPAVEPRAAATEPTARRKRRGFLVPIVIPVIITAGTTTALLIDHAPFQSQAQGPAGQQPSAAAPGTAGTTTPPTTAPAATTPAATTAPATTPPATTPPASATPVPNAAGQATPTRASGTGGAGGGGTASGGTAPQPPANTPAPPATGNQPPPANPAPQTPGTPAGCGGTKWGAIVSVASGQKLGLSKDTPSGGQGVLMGGNTAYGWVRSDPDPGGWYKFTPCNLSGPVLVQESDGRVALSGGFSVLTNWTVAAASTPGAFYLKDYMGQSCMTDNGPGNQVTMATCTPGNKSQEFRIP